MIPPKAFSERSGTVKTFRSIVYHGKLVNPEGKAVSGTFSAEIGLYSPEPSSCLLWAEKQTISVVNGGFSVEIGYDINRLGSSDGGVAQSFAQVFVNNSSLVLSSARCALGANYTAGESDDRILKVRFTNLNNPAERIEVNALPIKAVPFALQAEAIGGFGLSNLMKISGSGSSVLFSPAEVDSLSKLFGEMGDWDLGSKRLTNVAAPLDPTDAATKSWVESRIASVSGSGTISDGSISTSKLADHSVSFAKMQNITNNKILGRSTSGSGNIEELSIGSGLSLIGGTLSATGGGSGSVLDVTVSGLPLTVANGSSTPLIGINQANQTQAGYLSSADWTLFNSKQPAGAYLTSISSGDVQSALGYSPLSQTLPANQVHIGNGSNIASAGFFGVGQLRNASGTAQFPSSCTASQTLTWSAVTDVFSCTNIGSLPASAISSGTIDSARLPFGASLWQDGGSGKVYYNGGNIGIGTTTPSETIEIRKTGGAKIKMSGAPGHTLTLEDGDSALLIGNSQTATKFRMLPWDQGIHFQNTTSSGSINFAGLNGGDLTGDINFRSSGNIKFGQAAGASTGAQVVFSNNGKVGIGTTSPSTSLEVNGILTVKASLESAEANTNSSTAYTIPDLSVNIRRITLTGATSTITLPSTAGLSADKAYSLTIRVSQDATGNRTLAWSGNGNTIKWDSGAAPAPASAANTQTIYHFLIIGGESVWYASQVWKEN